MCVSSGGSQYKAKAHIAVDSPESVVHPVSASVSDVHMRRRLAKINLQMVPQGA